jgi:DNA repair protein RadA/Sms
MECGAWGTLAEGNAPMKAEKRGRGIMASNIIGFDAIPASQGKRIRTGIHEIDRVFGGGIVDGSATLLGGEPGVGKSTLALALCAAVAFQNKKALYVSGEESASQVKMRADRLKLASPNLFFLGETDLDAVLAALRKEKPNFVVIDSIQMLSAADIPADAAAMSQLRYVTSSLVTFAKTSGVSTLLIGHVTKDGQVAGPKLIEHVVDTVLSFEGERTHPLRILRALKNRFGSTDETGVFDMKEDGLHEVKNPSAYLLEERRSGVPGSVVSCILEGTRPVLIEIQALVQRTKFGYPARRASGFDVARVEMLAAILGRRGGLDLSQHDIYVNVIGGLKVKEPAVDLAVLAALASAASDVPLPDGLAVWGEAGLGGEIRSVIAADRRLQEAATLGITRVITALPRSGNLKKSALPAVTEAKTVREMIMALVPQKQKTTAR